MIDVKSPKSLTNILCAETTFAATIYDDNGYTRAVVIPESEEAFDTILDGIQLEVSNDRQLDYFRVEAIRILRWDAYYRSSSDDQKKAAIESEALKMLAAAQDNNWNGVNLLSDDSDNDRFWLFHASFCKDNRYQRELGSGDIPAIILTECDETGHVIKA